MRQQASILDLFRNFGYKPSARGCSLRPVPARRARNFWCREPVSEAANERALAYGMIGE